MTQRKITSSGITENIEFQGDSSTIPAGTTAERPATASPGMMRYNTTLGLMEQYSTLGWQSIDAPPVISSFSGTINADTNSTITITGSNFRVGAVIYVEGAGVSNTSRSLVTSYVSSTQLTANTAAATSNFVGGASYDIKVVNPSGLSATLSAAGLVDRDPIWSTSSGNIATINDAYGNYSPITTLSATDPDGTSVTFSLTSGSLPDNVSLDTSTGAISGDPINVVNPTTYTFEVTASSNSQSIPRTFNIIVNPYPDGSSSTRAATSALSLYDIGLRTDDYYWLNVNGTPRQIHCLLSSSFTTGFYSGNSGKAGWTLFAQRNVANGDIDITSNTGTADTTNTSHWAYGSWKQAFDSGSSYSTETEVLIDIDNTHTFVYNGWRAIALSLANSQIAIVRGYTGSYAVMTASDWNGTTYTSNNPNAGCSYCYRPRYKAQDSSYGYVRTSSMINSSNGTPCSDWCNNNYGLIYHAYMSPQLSKSGSCFGGIGGTDPCGFSGTALSSTGTIARFYFRERPV